MNNRPNPYVGPRPFKPGEKLPGRSREIAELLDLLIAERIVLLYSPSGAGKSSLIQAGLIPALQANGFFVYPTGRVNLDLADQSLVIELPEDHIYNRYIHSLLLSLEASIPPEQRLPPDDLFGMTFGEYLDRSCHNAEAEDSVVFVFDQFEEIITLHPTDREGKLEFFAQVGAALRSRDRWALFAMREDFMPALIPYARRIPTRLSSTYRLDFLSVEAAMQAVVQPPLEVGVEFDDTAACLLIDDLRSVKVQSPDGSVDPQPGLYVEPVQLQVVCYRMWERLDSQAERITNQEIGALGSVDQALAEYYAAKVSSAAEKARVSERLIREWIEQKLITGQGLRGSVQLGVDRSEGLPNMVISLLENAHLLRSEKRAGGVWFELTHDRMIKPVRDSNCVWLHDHLNLLQRQARLWVTENRADSLLLRAYDLEEAVEWADQNPSELTADEKQFLAQSQEAAQRERETLLMAEQKLKLEAAERLASVEKERAAAETQRAEAEAQRAEAQALRAEAEAQRAEAEAQRAEAEAQKAQAETLRAEEQGVAAQKLRRRAYWLTLALGMVLLLAIVSAYSGNVAVNNSYAASTAREEAVFNANQASTQEAYAVANAALASTQETIARAEAARAAEKEQEARDNAIEAQKNFLDAQRNAQSAQTQQAAAETALADAVAQKGTAEAFLGDIILISQQSYVEAPYATPQPSDDNPENPSPTSLPTTGGGGPGIEQMALSRGLASLALNAKDSDLNLSLLLAVEAHKLADTAEARFALLSVLQELPDQPLAQVLFTNDIPVTTSAVSPSGRYLALGTSSGDWYVLDTSDGRVVRSNDSYAKTSLTAVTFSPNEERLAFGAINSQFEIWPISRSSRNSGFWLTSGVPTSLAFRPDGLVLATGGTGQAVYWYNAGAAPSQQFHLLRDLPRNRFVSHLDWNAATGDLAIGATDGSVRVLTEKGEELPVLAAGSRIIDLRWSKDGRWLAAAVSSANDASALYVWEAASQYLSQVSLPAGRIQRIHFSPLDEYLVIGTADSSLYLWRLEGGYFAGPPLNLRSVKGTLLAMGSSESALFTFLNTGEFIAWNLDSTTWADLACQAAARQNYALELTREQWERFFPNRPQTATCLVQQ